MTLKIMMPLKYAAIRNILLRKGKSVEILANYEPIFHYVSEWWKQLYGESEGKDQKGMFPASVDLTTDLHSMGQFIQDGSRIMFETVMELEKPAFDLTIQKEDVDLDGLNYLAGKDRGFCQQECHERNHPCSYRWKCTKPDGKGSGAE